MEAVELIFLGAPEGGFSAYPRKGVGLFRDYDNNYSNQADFFEMKVIGKYVIYVYGVNGFVTKFGGRGGSNFSIALRLENKVFTNIKYAYECLKKIYQQIKREGKVFEERKNQLGFSITDMEDGRTVFERWRSYIINDFALQEKQLFEPIRAIKGRGKKEYFHPQEANKKLLDVFWQTGSVTLFPSKPFEETVLVESEVDRVLSKALISLHVQVRSIQEKRIKPLTKQKSLDLEHIKELQTVFVQLEGILKKIKSTIKGYKGQQFSTQQMTELRKIVAQIQGAIDKTKSSKKWTSIQENTQKQSPTFSPYLEDLNNKFGQLVATSTALENSLKANTSNKKESNKKPWYQNAVYKQIGFVCAVVLVLFCVVKPAGEWMKTWNGSDKEDSSPKEGSSKEDSSPKEGSSKEDSSPKEGSSKEDSSTKEGSNDKAGDFKGTTYYLNIDSFLSYAAKEKLVIDSVDEFGVYLIQFLEEKSTYLKNRCSNLNNQAFWEALRANNKSSINELSSKIKRDKNKNKKTSILNNKAWAVYIKGGVKKIGFILLKKDQTCP
ncbi:MAG: hypothetical protein ACRBFS_25320 [Aureispira sp.]